jgi:uncharacterized protein (DUF2235 family)
MAKNIVLCADGTWNTPHGVDVAGNTNVRKFYMGLLNSPTQLKYYDSGVGTDGTPIDHLVGGAMGEGLFQKIQDCYAFLGNVYDPGDKIYLIGFSRGAFTARSLGGMIAGFGVPSINLDNRTFIQVFEAYRETDANKKAALKKQLTQDYGLTDVTVEMVGVWDTVGSLGIPGIFFNAFNAKRYGFLDTTLHECVQYGFHAICIDEKRAQFEPTLWTSPDDKPIANSEKIQQVWFPGVHCDVGGSYAESQLSDISLSWMMQKAKERGLEFSPEAEKQYLIPPPGDALGQAHEEWKLVPWGLPKHREIPPIATIANTVQMRLDGKMQYAPENVSIANGKLNGYSIAQVLPYQKV